MLRILFHKQIHNLERGIDMRKLYKSETNSTICGVCGGIAEYFNLDVTIVRLIWIAFTFFGGSGVIAYIVAALIMPDAPPANEPPHFDPPPSDWGNGNNN